MRAPLLAVALVAALGGGAAARADGGFEALADHAVPVAGEAGVAGLFWSQVAHCDRAADDFERRQCEGVRQARRARVAQATFLVTAEGALRVGAFDPKSKSVAVEVVACPACQGVQIDGARRHIVGRGPVAVEGGRVRGKSLQRAAQAFRSADEAAAWLARVAPRLRTEMLVRLPAALESWKQPGAEGYRVDVIGFRVIDPCTGRALWSSPVSRDIGADPSTCGAEPEVAAPPPRPAVAAPAAPELPATLSPEDVRQALVPAREAAQKCFDTYGVAGKATFVIAIAADGQIASLEQKGDFLGTPTGDCLVKAVKPTRFPPSRKARTTVSYPFVLR